MDRSRLVTKMSSINHYHRCRVTTTRSSIRSAASSLAQLFKACIVPFYLYTKHTSVAQRSSTKVYNENITLNLQHVFQQCYVQRVHFLRLYFYYLPFDKIMYLIACKTVYIPISPSL